MDLAGGGDPRRHRLRAMARELLRRHVGPVNRHGLSIDRDGDINFPPPRCHLLAGGRGRRLKSFLPEVDLWLEKGGARERGIWYGRGQIPAGTEREISDRVESPAHGKALPRRVLHGDIIGGGHQVHVSAPSRRRRPGEG
ncbi:MAG: hypothetical protein METHAR1v1_690004 [Methanothrix sp.]|nr:MAG: hypothetical protein METHAR1v1_690004 [Methanothrix sp.]